MKYQELKDGIKRHLNAAAEDFFTVGYYLRQISENALFLEDGYESVWAFAKGEYGLSASSASRFMAINSKFSIDGGQTMEQKYIGMGVSKLQEMLTLPDEDLEKITQETTVKEIRAMKAAKNPPLSALGWPLTKYPENSLLTTEGCSPEGGGKGGQHCFSCFRDCPIRVKPRQCYTSATEPCTFTKEDREQVEKFSIHGKKCLHIHPELAPTRAGDGEPTPCCLLCEEFKSGSCNMLCCDVAKKEREKKQKEQEREWARQAAECQKAEKEKEKEKEAARRNIRESEWRILYGWLNASEIEEITAAALKDKHGKSHRAGTVSGLGGPNHSGWADCSPRGIRIATGGTKTKEETWAAAAKALKQIHKEEQIKRPAPERSEVDIIDAEFTEVSTEAAADQLEGATGARAAFEKAKAKLQARQQGPEVIERQPWKHYKARDVKDLLEKQRFDLEQYEILNEGVDVSKQIPATTLRKAQILTDALQALYEELERQEAAEDEE